MAIDDPTALPESEEACNEYTAEADRAWDGGDNDRALALYRAVAESMKHTDDQRSHAAHRLALIYLNAGDHDTAWQWASESHEPGAADVLHVIGNATHEDAPDPNVIPQTPEASLQYWDLGQKAKDAGDWATAASWFSAVVEGPGETDVLGRARVNLAICYHGLGQDEIARAWLNDALPMLDSSIMDDIEGARALFGDLEMGEGHPEAADALPAQRHLDTGIAAYQAGDAAGAREALEAATSGEGTTEEIRGKAWFYLGTMARQEASYQDARRYLHWSSTRAPEPERSWALQILEEKWGDEPPQQ